MRSRLVGKSPFTAGVALLGIALSMVWSRIQFKSDEDGSSLLAMPFHPELYHGEGITHHFFEGWYHKLVRTQIDFYGGDDENIFVADTEPLSMAVVPGVFYDSGKGGKNESHAFIFVTINGEKQHYYRFDLETEFRYKRFGPDSNDDDDEYYYIEIGKNRFSEHGMSLDLLPRISSGDERDNDDASIALKGIVRYEGLSPWPIPSKWNLGAMGPVGYFLSPFLECYHDVLSFDHAVSGSLTISTIHNGGDENHEENHSVVVEEEFFNTDCQTSDETKAPPSCLSSRGYVEKDRGRSFPSLWIWIQTNSFRKPPHNRGTSLFFSVARIPILLGTTLERLLPSSWSAPEFPGFTAAIWLRDDASMPDNKRLIPFATWTGAYFEDLVVDDEKVVVVVNSGGIEGGLWGSLWPSSTRDQCSIVVRVGRYVRAWIGSWFLDYDSRKRRYRLELVADRSVPHVLLYAPRTRTLADGTISKMEPFVNEALNAKVRVRLYEYYSGEEVHERLLLDDVGEHAGLEVHQNVQYLVDNLCGKPTVNQFTCL